MCFFVTILTFPPFIILHCLFDDVPIFASRIPLRLFNHLVYTRVHGVLLLFLSAFSGITPVVPQLLIPLLLQPISG